MGCLVRARCVMQSLAKRGAGPAGQGAQPSQGAQQGTRYQSRGRSAQAHGGRPSNGRAASAGGHKEMPAAAGLPKHQSLQQLLQSSPAPAAKHQRRSSQSSLTHTRVRFSAPCFKALKVECRFNRQVVQHNRLGPLSSCLIQRLPLAVLLPGCWDVVSDI